MAVLINKVLVIDSNTEFYSVYKRKLARLHCSLTFVSNISSLRDIRSFDDYSFILVSHTFRRSSGLVIYDYIRSRGYSGQVIILASEPNVKCLYLNGIAGVVDKNLNTEDFIKFLSVKLRDYFIFQDKSDRIQIAARV